MDLVMLTVISLLPSDRIDCTSKRLGGRSFFGLEKRGYGGVSRGGQEPEPGEPLARVWGPAAGVDACPTTLPGSPVMRRAPRL